MPAIQFRGCRRSSLRGRYHTLPQPRRNTRRLSCAHQQDVGSRCQPFRQSKLLADHRTPAVKAVSLDGSFGIPAFKARAMQLAVAALEVEYCGFAGAIVVNAHLGEENSAIR